MPQRPVPAQREAMTSAPRLVLKPALRRLWRDTSTLQLGVAAPHARVLSGLTAADRAVLALLDGSRSTDEVLDAAGAAGCDRADAARLIDALTHADALDDADRPVREMHEDDRQRLEPDALSLSLQHTTPGAAARILERRRRAVVAVHGNGRVGASVAMLLTAAGVGRLACLDPAPMRARDMAPGGVAEMVTDTRAAAVASRAARLSSSVHVAVERPRRTTLAVLTPAASFAMPELAAAVRDEPHLLACVSETTGVVGPLVVPGRTPCLRCVSLARGERDPHWPVLAAQLVGAAPTVEPCDVVLASLVSSLAAREALAWIDGADRPATCGGVLEYDLRAGTLRRRTVTAHPSCGCGALDAAAPDTRAHGTGADTGALSTAG